MYRLLDEMIDRGVWLSKAEYVWVAREIRAVAMAEFLGDATVARQFRDAADQASCAVTPGRQEELRRTAFALYKELNDASWDRVIAKTEADMRRDRRTPISPRPRRAK